jgi:hypothetical protein
MTNTDKIGLGGLIASVLGLIVAVLGGIVQPLVASEVGIGLVLVCWMSWVTMRLLAPLRNAEPSVKSVPTPALPYDSYYSAFVDHLVTVEKSYQKAKLPSAFIAWPRFSMLFWVNITEEFFRSHNNRYLSSYTTDVVDSSGHPNAFYLGIAGGSANWRFVIKGASPNDCMEINFASANNFLGWKMIAVRWREDRKHLDFCIDAGHAHREARDVPAQCWPESDSRHQFHVGGWQDNWPGGVSGLQFYNFRVYKTYLSDGDLETALERESKFLRDNAL